MKYIELKKEGQVFIITLANEAEANTFTTEMLRELNSAFDEIEDSNENAALIITAEGPKFWSNGINLQWLAEQGHEKSVEFLYEFKGTFLRACLLNLPTVGCLTGHAFAGGAILAASMDFRFMRNDRAKFCFPEVSHSMPLGETLISVINNIPSPHAVHHLVLTGTQWKGPECLEHHVVTGIFPEDELFQKTLDFARELATKNRKNYTGLKYDLKPGLVEMWQKKRIL